MTAPCVVKRTVAWGVAAVPLAVWVASFLPALVPAPASDPLPAMLREWLPGLFVGVALARCTVPPWRRLIGWVGALAALWLVPAVAGVITSTLGTRLVMGSPTRMLAFAREAWAFWIAQPQWGPLAVAVGVGLAGAALVRVLGPPRGQPTRT
ncbi:hypothetical protein G7070_04215 [Propioniciclava coleopterorum]|uniref:Uncharacterized protein n=1 Tax=Propioniciclava coleopterorum TaxID=2714937 RepID=A0A6G7Y471_9ACTN|nr:hypothetical protein [Propioniciclava coleopterorum]QIK71620.1 hypothetical protein G7070_04215 [Propioniciclava coleopterorum]